MSGLSDILLEKQTLTNKKNIYYLSAYFPINEQNRANIDTYIKSYLLKALRKHKVLINKTRLHKNIIEKILGSFTPFVMKKLNQGIGVFIQFNDYKHESGRVDEIDDSKIEIVTFSRMPKRDVFVGNVYQLDQLIWMENIYSEAIVLNFSEKKCDIFEIESDQINKIDTLDNAFLKDEKEFSRVYVPTGNIATTHSTGGNIKKRNHSEQNRSFVKEVVDYILSPEIKDLGYEYIVVIYSSSYSDFIKDILSGYKHQNGELITLMSDRNIDDLLEILKLVKSKIQEYQKTNKIDELEKARSNYSHYSEGWVETLSAVNMKKVSRLFIKPRIVKEGYLHPQTKLLYTYPKRGTIKIRNLAPWLVRMVKNSGGELVVLRGDRYKNLPEIAAELRYPKKRQNRNNSKAIRKWVEQHDGKPAIVRGTNDLLRIKFFDIDSDLEEIRWDKFFQILKEKNLIFIYDTQKDSRFCTFVNKE